MYTIIIHIKGVECNCVRYKWLKTDPVAGYFVDCYEPSGSIKGKALI
jgi:hypothetical protein